MGVQHQDRLDLGVVVRVVAREQLDPAAVGHPEARGGVGDPAADDQRSGSTEKIRLPTRRPIGTL